MNPQHPKFVMSAIFLLFFAPLLLAVLMRSSWWDFKPSGAANQGALVQPPLPLPVVGLERQYAPPGKVDAAQERQWVLLYPFPGECDADCLGDVTGLRQIHRATGRHREKVSLWLLSQAPIDRETQKRLISLYPEFIVLVDTTDDAIRTLASIVDAEADTTRTWKARQAFLIDPAANIILSYAAVFDPNDIIQDLERLLKWSGQE